jgi:glucosamine-6-phosphate deaminase
MSKQFQVDTLMVRISENRPQLGANATRLAAKKLKELLARKDFVNIVFAAAPSQNEFLAALAKEANIDWTRIRASTWMNTSACPRLHRNGLAII